MPWQKNFDIDKTLDRAMQTFWAHGYEATSMRNLLDVMEINRGSLYDTYGDKRTLFIAALKRYDEKIRKARLRSLQSSHPPLEAIQALFNDWIEQVMNDPERGGCFLTNTALELSTHDAEISNIVARSQKAIERFFLENIRNAQTQGRINLKLDATAASKSLLATLLGLLVLSRSRPERKLLQTIADEAISRLR